MQGKRQKKIALEKMHKKTQEKMGNLEILKQCTKNG